MDNKNDALRIITGIYVKSEKIQENDKTKER